MRRFVLTLCAIFVLAPTAHAGEFSAPKEVVGFYEADADVGPDHLPLTPVSGSTSMSESFLVRQIGPIDLDAGDCLDVRAREQFLNRNNANGWWTVGGVQSEHWWLWVGGAIGIRYSTGPPAGPGAGSIFRRPTGENWDWAIHRWHWDASEVRCFPSALSDLYLFTHVRWFSSPSYRQSNDQYVINDQIGRLEVLHYGTP